MSFLKVLFPRQKKIQIILLLILLSFSFFIRIYNISKSPASLYIDEVDYGLQARSLIETFRDYHGERSPFWVHSFNDIRTPIPAYATVLTTLLFKTPELQVRGSAILFGVLVVYLIFLLVKLWTKNFTAAVITATVFALNPWQIQFSRFAHEVMPMLAFYLSGIYFFYKAQEGKSYRFLVISTVLLSLSVYAYRTMSLFVPLTFLFLFILYRKDLFVFGLKRLFILIIIAGVIISPFLYKTTLGAPDVPRIAQLSIFSDSEVPIWVQRNREIDSADFINPQIGKKATLSSFFYHNKPLSWLDAFSNNYLKTFSTEFLFVNGDRNQRHSIGQMGHFYVVDIAAIFVGLYYLAKNFAKKEYQWLTIWLIAAPIPASLTIDGGQHAARLFIFSAPLLLLIGLGWWRIYETFKKINYHKLVLSILILTVLVQPIFYLHRYFVHYPLESARYFGYGFKEAALKIKQLEPNYQRVVMVPTKDPPILYYLFWANINSRLIQEHGMNFSPERIKDSSPLAKYTVIDWPHNIGEDPEVARYLRTDTLYLVTQQELPYDLRNNNPPKGIKLLDLILYPDNEVAFYLIAKDPVYKVPLTEPKFKEVNL